MRLEGLLIALLLTWRALYEAFYLGERPMDDALMRFAVTAFVASIGVGALRGMYLTYASRIQRRRKTDFPTGLDDLAADLPPQRAGEIADLLRSNGITPLAEDGTPLPGTPGVSAG